MCVCMEPDEAKVFQYCLFTFPSFDFLGTMQIRKLQSGKIKGDFRRFVFLCVLEKGVRKATCSYSFVASSEILSFSTLSFG